MLCVKDGGRHLCSCSTEGVRYIHSVIHGLAELFFCIHGMTAAFEGVQV